MITEGARLHVGGLPIGPIHSACATKSGLGRQREALSGWWTITMHVCGSDA